MKFTVVPFPARCRLRHIQKTATAMAKADAKWADSHLREQLRRLADGLRQKGVPEEAVQAEAAAYEGAILDTLRQMAPRSGGTR
jgi:hypothetical protein